MNRLLRAFNLLCAAAMIGLVSLWLYKAAPRVAAGGLDQTAQSAKALARVLQVEASVVDPQLQVVMDDVEGRARRVWAAVGCGQIRGRALAGRRGLAGRCDTGER